MSEDLVGQIRSKLDNVMDRVFKAANKKNRDIDSIRLIVVTKGQPIDIVSAAIQVGARILGENYAEEAVEKINTLDNQTGVEWHMIGHVQSRKTDLVANNFSLLHSLDSLKLAKKLDQSLMESGKVMPVLLEFNIGGEMSKYGWQVQESKNWIGFLPEIEQILELSHLNVRGLMTMPPFEIDPEESRSHFISLRKLRDFMEKQFPGTDLKDLSMGTSSDYEIAVEEGASYIRVGKAILGERISKRG
jgi:pyridoxal phosphate enzyme (YggS family)